MLKNHKCELCKEQFIDYISNKRRFCSKECASKSMSLSMSGRCPKGLKKWRKNGGKPWNKGLIGSMSREKNGNWKGGEYKNMGYVYTLFPSHPLSRKNGYVLRSRLIIEKYLGRFTTKQESPHHINKIRNDDRVENLILYKNKSAHNKAEHNIKISKSDIVLDGSTIKQRRK